MTEINNHHVLHPIKASLKGQLISQVYISGLNATVNNLQERKYIDRVKKLEKSKKFAWNIELINKFQKNL